jgi:hypothetical protein
MIQGNIVMLTGKEAKKLFCYATINASYNQRLFAWLKLTTKYEANTCVSLPTTVITSSVVQD